MLAVLSSGFIVGCSFLVVSNVSFDGQKLAYANELNQRRGPDRTTHVRHNNVDFVHNLLWLTGALTTQPFVGQHKHVIATFNGEVYNYRELPLRGAASFRTDGEALLPMYREYGESFPTLLNGEYAIVVADFERDLLVLASDAFGTKPFWWAAHGCAKGSAGRVNAQQARTVRDCSAGGFAWGVASYASALHRLGFSDAKELEPNTIEVRQLSTFALLSRRAQHTFDLRQHKNHLADWDRALHVSMARRAGTLQHGAFLGLSAGVDSGVIALRLSEMRVPYHLWSLAGAENTGVLSERHAYLRNHSHGSSVIHPTLVPTREDFLREMEWMAARVEGYTYTQPRRRIPLITDAGSVGMSYINQRATKLGLRVYLSGAGSDEIYHDYGRIKRFPPNLSKIFPWATFAGFGRMRDYLRKEELVAGAHGIESRYPLLDVDLVQERSCSIA